MEIKHIIEPERIGLWVAVTFILALLALVVGILAINRANETAMATQMQVLMLNKKIENAKQQTPAAPAMAQEAAPAAK